MPPDGGAHRRYADWLDIRHTIYPALDSSSDECEIQFRGGLTDLRRFKWSGPVASTWHTREHCYFLSLVLDRSAGGERRNVAAPQAARYGGKRVLLVAPGQTICSSSVGGGHLRSMRCFIDAGFIDSICSRKPSGEERTKLGAIDFSGSAVEWLLFRMYREMSAGGIGAEIVIESIAREIAVTIARTIEGRRRDARRRSGGLPAWRMRLIVDRVYAERPLPKVSDLAELSGLTVRHLGRAFYAEAGKTIGKFIASAMAERAGEMLKAGIPVGVVAATLGYASSSSFAHAFHRETGVLPSIVRDGERHRQA